jgi:hypothetical protein
VSLEIFSPARSSRRLARAVPASGASLARKRGREGRPWIEPRARRVEAA